MPPRTAALRIVALSITCGAFAACSPTPAQPEVYEPRTLEARDRVLAEELCDRAEPLMESDPAAAEALLLDALTSDVFSGRAHNNLGVIYLQRGMLYEAAGEFEFARKILPDHPDPRINLGLTLERAGRIDEAISAYAAAYDLQPEHLGAMQALARAQLRYNRADDRTLALLETISLRGDERWRAWAMEQRQRSAE